MSLAVAGLSSSEIKARTQRLANDWGTFTATERRAFQFAHQLARDPGSLSAADRAGLVKTFGADRAVDIIWHAAWCNYMTRVADAFQFPLETENVFAPPPPSSAGASATPPAKP